MSRMIKIIDGRREYFFPKLKDAARSLHMPDYALRYRLDGNTYDKGEMKVKDYRQGAVTNSKAVKVICIAADYSIVYDSISAAAEELGCSVSTVRRRIDDRMNLYSAEFGVVKVRFA